MHVVCMHVGKVSCQPATITYQIKYFIGIYVQLCLKSSNPTLIFKFPFSDFDNNICELTRVLEGYVVWGTVSWVRVFPLAGLLGDTVAWVRVSLLAKLLGGTLQPG